MNTDLSEVGRRARRKAAVRLLPFLFVMYVISYIDRTNVSFANLRMSADLGFSDRVYGLGVGIFFIGYVLFEIPGAIIVERWSARKWLARIMISWGLVTILNGFVQTRAQFYGVRLLVGAAEASFFPGVIVYLTHWFRQSDRAKAIACFYAAVPGSSIVGSLIAAWLLEVHWFEMAGWRWIFIVEGIAPVLLGVITLFYLTDRPEQATWLSTEEREWLAGELAAETLKKKRVRDWTIRQALVDKHVLLLLVVWLLALAGAQSNTYWLPTFIKRVAGLPGPTVAFLVTIPGLVGVAGMLLNSWHSDKTGERRWHIAIPLACAGCAYMLVPLCAGNIWATMALFVVGGGVVFSYYPVFWSIPTTMLSESAAAASFGFINSIGQLGGFVGPTIVGQLNDRTGTLTAAFIFIGTCYLLAGSTVLAFKVGSAGRVAVSNR